MPSKQGYDWSDINSPPILEDHSVIKHKIVSDYLERYLDVVTINPRVNPLRINFVDGFAGGGRYRSEEDGSIVDGSPLVLLKTVKSAEAKINLTRSKEFSIDANYYFSEIDSCAIRQLEYALKENGYENSTNIKIFNQPFLNVAPSIFQEISSRSRSHPKNIILLDQYGYKDVPFEFIKQIFTRFPVNTEVILTFATDCLINYFADTPSYRKALENMSLENLLESPDLQGEVEIKQARLLIEQLLYDEIKGQCGAQFYTPFFIASRESNRAYWLIHLSTHPTARDQMLLTHWDAKNDCVHHGKPGLNMMLGYKPALEAARDQMFLEFGFDSPADELVTKALLNEIPSFIESSSIVTVQDLIFKTCNNSPATLEQYKNSLFELQQSAKAIKIRTRQGNIRRSANAISFEDGIEVNMQMILL
ncbi:three-Cys-motif partner protein TcmP [Teredinibacter turnerae]|uniref:three-Cys-motif partner protein TcmP n=1 Tax=Teredinibacter turnerae TaxID=2426 RepID=UPI0003FFB0DC|nr:three-Cys-motif partner protein TcmP [Teredinibacter turnerae]